jgi:transposase
VWRVATPGTDETSTDALRARIAALESALAAERVAVATERAAAAAALAAERDRLRAAYQRVLEELELLRRRIFVAKAERVDAAQLELEFAAKRAELAELATRLGAAAATDEEDEGVEANERPAEPKRRPKPKGRRALLDAPLAEERVELLDDELEGKAERIGFEESCRVAWRKAALVRVVVARAKYRVVDDAGESLIETTPMPPEVMPRSIADVSLVAKVLTSKFHYGMPFFRQEEELATCGFGIDRGTMSRWAEDVGMTLGATIVEAMRTDALTAFCIATDATGVCVQPEPSPTRGRQACRRGHFFTMIADCDHVLFEYVPRETSAAVAALFKGYSGYVQADAKSVYDVLFREPGPIDDDAEIRAEVGCWAHARRKFYEAAISKHHVAREALYRIRELFELERSWSGVPPAKRKALRLAHAKPRLDDFFAWAEVQYRAVENVRGLVRSAFGYVVRQKDALLRFLEDGRLRIDNNASERALRQIAVGRKAWLFVGSDDC